MVKSFIHLANHPEFSRMNKQISDLVKKTAMSYEYCYKKETWSAFLLKTITAKPQLPDAVHTSSNARSQVGPGTRTPSVAATQPHTIQRITKVSDVTTISDIPLAYRSNKI